MQKYFKHLYDHKIYDMQDYIKLKSKDGAKELGELDMPGWKSDTIEDILSEGDIFLVKVKYADDPMYDYVQHFTKGVLGFQGFIDGMERLYNYGVEHGENPRKYLYEVYLLHETKDQNGNPTFETNAKRNSDGIWELVKAEKTDPIKKFKEEALAYVKEHYQKKTLKDFKQLMNDDDISFAINNGFSIKSYVEATLY